MDESPMEDPAESIDSAKPAKGGPSVVMLLLMAVAGAGAGGYFGGPFAAPVIASVVAGGGGGGGHGADDGHGGGGAAEGPLTIENLVLNPAGSGASRFLIATLVLDADAAAQEELAARDAEARDLLLTILSTKTVEELTDIGRRDLIREELRSALNGMLGHEGVHRIFIPQFVIQ